LSPTLLLRLFYRRIDFFICKKQNIIYSRWNRRQKGPAEHAHTLNATLCAVPRVMVAIIENHQQSDGSVAVPAPLRKYMGGQEAITPRFREF
jgi:seryl-tRNA synthetase